MPDSLDAATLPPSGDPMPWERDDLLPEKPANSDYGYFIGKKSHPCTQEELVARCESKDVREVTLVWHPKASRVVPAAEVEFLFESLKKRKLNSQKTSISITIFYIGFWCFMLLTMGERRQNWYTLLLTVFGIIPLCENWIALRKLKQSNWEDATGERGQTRFGIWVSRQRAPWSGKFLGLILLIAGGQAYVGMDRSIAMAGLVKEAVWRGEWWRSLTGTLLHAHPLHLVLNALSLFYVGKVIEALSSRYHLALIFIFSALLGSIFSLFLLDVTSVGASGGIMGYIGFLLIMGLRQQTIMPKNYARSLAIAIIILAATGIVGVDFIDNAGHLGGLVGGLLIGMILIPKRSASLPLKPSTSIRVVGLISLTLLIICACGILKLFFFRS